MVKIKGKPSKIVKKSKLGPSAVDLAAKNPGIKIKVEKKTSSVTKPVVKAKRSVGAVSAKKNFGISNLKRG